jgi:hypothetical protein
MNFWVENGEKKIFERLHMPLNHKMKFVQNVIMSSRPIVLSQETVPTRLLETFGI